MSELLWVVLETLSVLAVKLLTPEMMMGPTAIELNCLNERRR